LELIHHLRLGEIVSLIAHGFPDLDATFLRERWKQVAMEKFNCALFLATVDDRVSADEIDDMSNQGIHLVVLESLKKSKETCYKDKTNVITFREFFDEGISLKRPGCRQS
jgi:hypothetical protein